MNAITNRFAAGFSDPLSRGKRGNVSALEAASPAYADVMKRKAKLVADLISAENAQTELVRKMQGSERSPGLNARDVRIAELAGRSAPPVAGSDQQKYAEIRERLGEIKEALSLIDLDVRAEWLNASAMVCDTVAKEHHDLMLALFEKLSEAHEIWVKHEALLDELRRGDVAHGRLRPESPTFFGRHPGDKQGDLAQWMRDLVSAGFITRDRFPVEYK